MTSYIRLALVACACIALASAQFEYDFGFSDGYLGTNFGAPSYNMLSMAAARDPRGNTGPVVFPPSPPGDPSQTSGVVVGASGYGFVPPSSQGTGVGGDAVIGLRGGAGGVAGGRVSTTRAEYPPATSPAHPLRPITASPPTPVPLGNGPALPRYFYHGFFLRR